MEQDIDSARCNKGDRSNAVISQVESEKPFCRNEINGYIERAWASDKNFQTSIADASYGEDSKRTTREQERKFDTAGEKDAIDMEEYCHVGPIRDVELPMNIAEEVTDLQFPMKGEVRNLPNCDRLCSTKYEPRDICFQKGRMAEFFGCMISLASFIDGGCSNPFSHVLRRFCAEKQSSLAEAMGDRDEAAISNLFCPASFPTYAASVVPESVLQESTSRTDCILHEQSFRAVLHLKHRVRELASRYNISYT